MFALKALGFAVVLVLLMIIPEWLNSVIPAWISTPLSLIGLLCIPFAIYKIAERAREESDRG
jgi:hypothetical protein